MATVFEHSIIIERPISEVFQYVADWQNTVEWQAGTGQVTVVPEGSLRIGAMVTQERKRGWLFNADVVDYQPNKVLALRGILGRWQVRDTYTFMPVGRTTKITIERVTPGGFFTRLMAPFMPMRIRRQINDDLARLKAILEAKER
ncbi:MAG: hypothetical protein D6712_12560 [Chloroflexi bacterium]|nr:MAG: hypothetical protein D6712_12560 [Chloroflexota bacterium]